MKRKISKKGIVFTIISVALSAVIIATFFFNIQVPLDSSVDRTGLRIKSINKYIEQLDTYIPAQTSSSSRATLKEMIDEMITADSYFASFTDTYTDCQMGITSPTTCTYGLQDKLDELDNIAFNQLTINSSLNVTNLEIYQVDPWYLTTKVNVSIDIIDSYAEWHFNKAYIVNTSFLGLYDPAYQVDVDGVVLPVSYPARFNTTIDRNITWVESPSTLNILAIDRLYFPLEGAPDFISRMNGQLTNKDTYGIASLVIPTGRPFDLEIAHTDYTYWEQRDCDRADVVLDFWSKPVNETLIRSRLNITDNKSEESIHTAVIPLKLLNVSNLNNTDYYNWTTC